jgi:hypothetical protein
MKCFKKMFIGVCALLFIYSCNNDDNDDNEDNNMQCDFETIIDLDVYEIASPSTYSIINAEVNENCLEITIGASGCDSENWEVKLASDYPLVAGDVGGVNISLKLTNNEVCLAYFETTYSFDLSELLQGLTSLNLSLEGWSGSLVATH